jgi:outer membrane lipopolysaccharide assembly protein LptE/RlpB
MRLKLGVGFVLALFVLGLTGCGYGVAGHSTRLPSTLHTIAIPAFINTTQTYRVEQLLTEATVREFVTRTQYRIVNHEDPNADATLHCVVTSSQVAPATYDTKTGHVSTALVIVTMKVTLTDHAGKVLYENPAYVFRDEYQISRELSSFFEEEEPALDRLSRDFARTLVSNILEAF